MAKTKVIRRELSADETGWSGLGTLVPRKIRLANSAITVRESALFRKLELPYPDGIFELWMASFTLIEGRTQKRLADILKRYGKAIAGCHVVLIDLSAIEQHDITQFQRADDEYARRLEAKRLGIGLQTSLF